MENSLTTAKTWLTDFFDPAVKKEVQQLIDNDQEELKDRVLQANGIWYWRHARRYGRWHKPDK